MTGRRQGLFPPFPQVSGLRTWLSKPPGFHLYQYRVCRGFPLVHGKLIIMVKF